MKSVNMHEAKTHLSRLVDEAAKGKPFIIAKAGKPLVQVIPLPAESKKAKRRLGGLEGQFHVPDDFDTMCSAEIEEMFYGPK